jgi:stage II sporulation protein D
MNTRNDSTPWRVRSRTEQNLWLAFIGGAVAASILWLFMHAAGTDVEIPLAGGKLTNTAATESLDDHAIYDSREQSQSTIEEYPQPVVRVYLSESGRIEAVPLETYVRGVVAAEMPVNFEPAALEAQALAARTYIVRRLWLEDHITGIPVKDADVTDEQTHQVYLSLTEMKRLKRENGEGWRKVDNAVKETSGKIIVFEAEPIEALFFSTSNGYTENSEEVFPTKLPYLRSVASPWDTEESPRAQETLEMELTDFYTKLGVNSIASAASPSGQPLLRIVEWTDGHRVKLLLAGTKKLTGEEVRHKLGLRSAAFSWTISNHSIKLTTFGSGHGVGMSQWGAEGMAKAGNTAQQIVEHYYSGVGFEEVSKLVNSTGKRL